MRQRNGLAARVHCGLFLRRKRFVKRVMLTGESVRLFGEVLHILDRNRVFRAVRFDLFNQMFIDGHIFLGDAGTAECNDCHCEKFFPTFFQREALRIDSAIRAGRTRAVIGRKVVGDSEDGCQLGGS